MVTPDGDPEALPTHGPDPVGVVRDALALPDPTERAAQLTSLLDDAQAWVVYLSAHRDQAVAAMRAQGISLGDIAQLLRLSKSRVQQICNRVLRDAGDEPDGD